MFNYHPNKKNKRIGAPELLTGTAGVPPATARDPMGLFLFLVAISFCAPRSFAGGTPGGPRESLSGAFEGS
jgi:hypothetical protein